MKFENLKLLQAILIATLLFTSCKKDPVVEIQEPTSTSNTVVTDSGNGTGNTTWTADKTYVLNGFVFVNAGQTLTIEPGTVIKGAGGTGSNASALIVARGGSIIAEGTSENPIIFTADVDDLNGSVDWRARGLWGGLIVLGNASLNSTGTTKRLYANG